MKSLRDKAKDANQFSAAIAAEVKRGELRKFYVKQVENREVDKFSRMSDEELEAYIAQQDALLAEIREHKPTIAARSNGRTKALICGPTVPQGRR